MCASSYQFRRKVTQLAARLDDFRVGDKSKLTVPRQGKSVSLEVVLQAHT